MRGEEIPFTPSEGRRKKKYRTGTESHVEELAKDGVVSSRIGSSAQPAESDAEIDELPESPVKPRRAPAGARGSTSNFRPIFDEPPINRSPIFGTSAATHQRIIAAISPSAALDPTESTPNPRSSPPAESGSLHGHVVMGTGAGSEFALHPPSPPPHAKQPAQHSNFRIARKNHSREIPTSDEEEDTSFSGHKDVVFSRNLAWGSHPRWLADLSSEDHNEEKNAFGEPILSPPRSPTGDTSPASNDELDISGNLRQALTISSTRDEDVAREAREAVPVAWPALLQGHQDFSMSRAASGIWDVGEMDDHVEDWESEPDGWNGSRDS